MVMQSIIIQGMYSLKNHVYHCINLIIFHYNISGKLSEIQCDKKLLNLGLTQYWRVVYTATRRPMEKQNWNVSSQEKLLKNVCSSGDLINLIKLIKDLAVYLSLPSGASTPPLLKINLKWGGGGCLLRQGHFGYKVATQGRGTPSPQFQ